MRRKWSFPFYPIIIGAAWVLAMYAEGIDIVPGPDVLWAPLATVILAVMVSMLALRIVVREWNQVALLSTLFLIMTIVYGHLLPFDPTTYPPLLHRVLLPLWTIFGICGVFIIMRTKGLGRRRLTTIGNIVSVGILVVVLTNVVLSGRGSSGAGGHQEYQVNPKEPLPDIFYIVPDEYASFDVLQSFYGYDNSEFRSFLEEKWFHVSPGAFSNYPDTVPSMASTLNMTYLTTRDGDFPKGMLMDNDVVRTLKKVGYQYIHVGSWFDVTATNKHADVNHNSSYGEFSWTLYKSTALYAIESAIVGSNEDDYCRGHTEGQVRYMLEEWEKDRDPGRPTFTLIHLLCPHTPFVFNADGSEATAEQIRSWEGDEGYLEQVKAVSGMIEDMVNHILEMSEDPVVILQADEGPNPAAWLGCDDYEGNPVVLENKFGILLACLVPEADEDLLVGICSPVNIFRLIFDTYLGTELGRLTDRNYISTELEVTEYIGEAW